MAVADRLERKLQTAKPAAPVVSKPQVAPTVATPQRTALATMGGSADTRERKVEAAKAGISQSAAAKNIDSRVQANLAMSGSKNSVGARMGGTADMREAANEAAAYGVSRGDAIKIRNTKVDTIRASQGLAPVYDFKQKVSKLPNALVASSGRGSMAAGWQSTGPVSAKSGNPLIPNLPMLDAAQDLRGQIAKNNNRKGKRGIKRDERRDNRRDERDDGFVEDEKTPTPSNVDQDALATMIDESDGFMNLLEPLSGSERRATQVDAPGRIVRTMEFRPTYGPTRRRNTFLRGM